MALEPEDDEMSGDVRTEHHPEMPSSGITGSNHLVFGRPCSFILPKRNHTQRGNLMRKFFPTTSQESELIVFRILKNRMDPTSKMAMVRC